VNEKNVLDYRSPGSPRVERMRSLDEALAIENVLITAFILVLFGAPILLYFLTRYGGLGGD
jgi:hypothetical protein